MGAGSVDPELVEGLSERGSPGTGFSTPRITWLAASGGIWRDERVLLWRVAPGYPGSGGPMEILGPRAAADRSRRPIEGGPDATNS